MRLTLITSVLLFAIHGTGKAQFIEVADQRGPDVVYNKIIDLGDRYVIGAWENREGETYGGSGHLIIIAGYDGVEIASIPVPMTLTGEWEWGFVSALIRSPVGGFYVAGFWDACDVADTSRLIHFGPDGTVLFNTTTPMNWGYGGYDVLAEEPFDHLAFISDSEITITDQMGDSITSWPNPNPGSWQTPVFGRWLPNGDLLLIAGGRIQVVDIGGNTLLEKQFTETIYDTRLYQDEILALSADSVHRLSLELTLLGSTPYTAGVGEPRFLTSDPAYFQVGHQLYQWTTLGTTLVLDPELLEGQAIRSMTVRNDTLFTCGNNEAHGFTAGLLRSYALDGSTSVRDVDAAIESVVVDSTWTYPATWNPNYMYIRANLEITIRNEGTVPIQSLVLGRRIGIPAAMCGLPSGQIPVTELPLMPGNSMTMLAEDLLISVSYIGTSVNDVINNICIVAQSPNGHVDRNHSNDRACVTLTTPVGMEELQGSPLTIYPNPFTDRIALELDGSVGRVEIQLFDLQGRMVHSASFDGVQRTVMMELPDITEGTYVLQLRSGDVLRTQRVVRSAK
jgi:hypothetical protein